MTPEGARRAGTFDGQALRRAAGGLAFPRYPGTPGDAEAIRIVAARLAAAGLEVAVEPFRYDLSRALLGLRTMLVGAAAAIGVATLAAARHPPSGLLLLAVALLAGSLLLGWSPRLERWFYQGGERTVTANVVGRRPAVGQASRTLVILAHHDSKSQNLTFPWRAGLTLTAVGGAVLLLAGLLGRSAGIGLGRWVEAAGLPAAAALLALACLASGDRSPGGVDNAGSLAILLELARRLPALAPPQADLVFLSTGAEEDHMVGAMRWLERHAGGLAGRPVVAFNLDGAGSPGRLALLDRFGFGRPFSPALSALFRRQAARLGVPLRHVWMPPAMGVDAIPFHHRGIPSVTLSSGALGPATWAIHSARDTWESLDPTTLAAAAELTLAAALAWLGTATAAGDASGRRG